MNDPFSPDGDDDAGGGLWDSISSAFERFTRLTQGTAGESARATAEYASDLAPNEDVRENFLIIGRIHEGVFDKLDRVFNQFTTGDEGTPTDSELFVDRIAGGEPLAQMQLVPGPLRDLSQEIEAAQEKFKNLLEIAKNFGDPTGDGGTNPIADALQTIGAVADQLEEGELGTILGGLGRVVRDVGDGAGRASGEGEGWDFPGDSERRRGEEGAADAAGLLEQLQSDSVTTNSMRSAFTALSQIDYSSDLEQLRINVEKLRAHTAVASPN